MIYSNSAIGLSEERIYSAVHIVIHVNYTAHEVSYPSNYKSGEDSNLIQDFCSRNFKCDLVLKRINFTVEETPFKNYATGCTNELISNNGIA